MELLVASEGKSSISEYDVACKESWACLAYSCLNICTTYLKTQELPSTGTSLPLLPAYFYGLSQPHIFSHVSSARISVLSLRLIFSYWCLLLDSAKVFLLSRCWLPFKTKLNCYLPPFPKSNILYAPSVTYTFPNHSGQAPGKKKSQPIWPSVSTLGQD